MQVWWWRRCGGGAGAEGDYHPGCYPSLVAGSYRPEVDEEDGSWTPLHAAPPPEGGFYDLVKDAHKGEWFYVLGFKPAAAAAAWAMIMLVVPMPTVPTGGLGRRAAARWPRECDYDELAALGRAVRHPHGRGAIGRHGGVYWAILQAHWRVQSDCGGVARVHRAGEEGVCGPCGDGLRRWRVSNP